LEIENTRGLKIIMELTYMFVFWASRRPLSMIPGRMEDPTRNPTARMITPKRTTSPPHIYIGCVIEQRGC